MGLRNKLTETKITVHLVDEGLDTGPILAQQPVDLRGADTLAEVERRGLAVEHELYARTLAELIKKDRHAERSEASRLPPLIHPEQRSGQDASLRSA